MTPKRPAVKAYPFTGMIVCGNCGARYRRKTTNGRVAWNCTTFLCDGKAACHTKQIPESILYELTNDALGLDAFDADVFKAAIKEIRVPAFNHVVFVFNDGHEVERVWQDRSRSESWTDEMREKAREHAQKRYPSQ